MGDPSRGGGDGFDLNFCWGEIFVSILAMDEQTRRGNGGHHCSRKTKWEVLDSMKLDPEKL